MKIIDSDELLLTVTRWEMAVLRQALVEYPGLWPERPDEELSAGDVQRRNEELDTVERMTFELHNALGLER